MKKEQRRAGWVAVKGHTLPALPAPISLSRPAEFEPASPPGAETQSRMAGCSLASCQRSLPALEPRVLGCVWSRALQGHLGGFPPRAGPSVLPASPAAALAGPPQGRPQRRWLRGPCAAGPGNTQGPQDRRKGEGSSSPALCICKPPGFNPAPPGSGGGRKKKKKIKICD